MNVFLSLIAQLSLLFLLDVSCSSSYDDRVPDNKKKTSSVFLFFADASRSQSKYRFQRIYSVSSRNQASAAQDCINRGGWLAAPLNQAEYDDLKLDVSISGSDWVWLGASDSNIGTYNMEGKWSWRHGPPEAQGRYFWSGTSSGNPLNDLFNDWYTSGNQPNNNGCCDDYLVWYSSARRWYDEGTNSASIRRWACQFVQPTYTKPEPISDWTYKRFTHPSTLTRSEAHSQCRSKGGYLASMLNAEEWLKIRDQCYGGSWPSPSSGIHNGAWMAGADNDPDEGVWKWKWARPARASTIFWRNSNPVGSRCAQDDCFWGPGEPSNSGSSEHSLMLAPLTTHQYWNDAPDASGFRDYLCEFPPVPTATATTSESESALAGEPSLTVPHQRYKLFTISVGLSITHDTANFECEKTGGWLATIPDYEAQMTIDRLFRFSSSRPDSWVAIGASDIAVDGEWRWTAGPHKGKKFFQGTASSGGCEAGMYCNWHSINPSNNGGTEHYGYIDFRINGFGLWNDARTDTTAHYLCEYDMRHQLSNSYGMSWTKSPEAAVRYKFYADREVEYEEAFSKCSSYGGWLATIPDQAAAKQLEQEMTRQFVSFGRTNQVLTSGKWDDWKKEWFWSAGPLRGKYFSSGINTATNGGCFLGMTGIQMCNWVSGEDGCGGNTFGCSSQPLLALGHTTRMTWNNVADEESDVQGYVCEFSPASATQLQDHSQSSTLGEGHDLGGRGKRRYKFFSIHLQSGERLDTLFVPICERDGGWLATVPDESAWRNILHEIKENSFGDILNNNNEIAFGLKWDSTDEWHWGWGPMKGTKVASTDGTQCYQPFGYCPWLSSSNSAGGVGQDFVLLHNEEGKWNNHPPTPMMDAATGIGDIGGFVCEYPDSRTQVPTPTSTLLTETLTFQKGQSETYHRKGAASTTKNLASSQTATPTTSKTLPDDSSQTFHGGDLSITNNRRKESSRTVHPENSATESKGTHSDSSSRAPSASSTLKTPSTSLLVTTSVSNSLHLKSATKHPFLNSTSLSKRTLSRSISGFSDSSSRTQGTQSDTLEKEITRTSSKPSFSHLTPSITLRYSWIEISNETKAVPIASLIGGQQPTGATTTITAASDIKLVVLLQGGDSFDPATIRAFQQHKQQQSLQERHFLLQQETAASSPSSSFSLPSGTDMTQCLLMNSTHPSINIYTKNNVTATVINTSAVLITFRHLAFSHNSSHSKELTVDKSGSGTSSSPLGGPLETKSQLKALVFDQTTSLNFKEECLKQRLGTQAVNFTFLHAPVATKTTFEEVLEGTKDAVEGLRAIPGIASAGARSGLILTLADCEPEFYQRLGSSQNPVGLDFGIPKYGQYISSAVFNNLIILASAGLHFAVAVFYSKKYTTDLSTATSRVRFPSLTIIPVLAFLEPTCMAAAVVMLYGDNFGIKLVGVLAEILCFGYVIGLFFYLRKTWAGVFIPGKNPGLLGPKKVTAIEDDDDPNKNEAKHRTFCRRFLSWIGYFIDGGVKWKDEDPENNKGYCRRNRLLFMDFTGKWYWFLSAELLVAAICGMLDGIKLGTGECNGIIIALIVVLFLFFVFICFARPYNAPFLLLFSVILTLIQLAAATLMGISMLSGEEELQDWAEWLTLVAFYVIIGRAFFDISPKLKQLIGNLIKKCNKKKGKDNLNVDLTEQLLVAVREDDNVQVRLQEEEANPQNDQDNEAAQAFREDEYGDAGGIVEMNEEGERIHQEEEEEEEEILVNLNDYDDEWERRGRDAWGGRLGDGAADNHLGVVDDEMDDLDLLLANVEQHDQNLKKRREERLRFEQELERERQAASESNAKKVKHSFSSRLQGGGSAVGTDHGSDSGTKTLSVPTAELDDDLVALLDGLEEEDITPSSAQQQQKAEGLLLTTQDSDWALKKRASFVGALGSLNNKTSEAAHNQNSSSSKEKILGQPAIHSSLDEEVLTSHSAARALLDDLEGLDLDALDEENDLEEEEEEEQFVEEEEQEIEDRGVSTNDFTPSASGSSIPLPPSDDLDDDFPVPPSTIAEEEKEEELILLKGGSPVPMKRELTTTTSGTTSGEYLTDEARNNNGVLASASGSSQPPDIKKMSTSSANGTTALLPEHHPATTGTQQQPSLDEAAMLAML